MRFCLIAGMLFTLCSIFSISFTSSIQHTIEVSVLELDPSDESIQEIEELQEEENECITEPTIQLTGAFRATNHILEKQSTPLGFCTNLVPPPWQNC